MAQLILVGDGQTDMGAAMSVQQMHFPATYNLGGTSNAVAMSIPVPHVDHTHKVYNLVHQTYQAFYAIGNPEQHRWPFELQFSKTFLDDVFRSHTEITEWVEANCERNVLLRYTINSDAFTFYFYEGAEQVAFSAFVWAKHAARRTLVELTEDRTLTAVETWAADTLGGKFKIDTTFRQIIIWCEDEEDTVTCRLRWNGSDETAD